MARAAYLGELELMVLLTLDRLQGQSYGMEVFDEIVRTTGREISAPTVYVTLARLEKKGYARTQTGAPSGRRGGRPKKFYIMTESGRHALARSRHMFEQLWGRPTGDVAPQPWIPTPLGSSDD